MKSSNKSNCCCLICTEPLLKGSRSHVVPLPSQDIVVLVSKLFQIPNLPSSVSDPGEVESLELCGFCQIILQEASHLMEDILRFQSRLESIGDAVRQKIIVTTNDNSPPPTKKSRSERSPEKNGVAVFRRALMERWTPNEILVEPEVDETPPTIHITAEVVEEQVEFAAQDPPEKEIVHQRIHKEEMPTHSLVLVKLEADDPPADENTTPEPPQDQEENLEESNLPGCSWEYRQTSISPTPAQTNSSPLVRIKQEVVWELVKDRPPHFVAEEIDESMGDPGVENSVPMLQSGEFNPGEPEAYYPQNFEGNPNNGDGNSSGNNTGNDTNFQCPECGKVFRKIYNLGRHRVLHDPNPPQMPCPICGKMFKCKDYLRGHIYRKHPDQYRTYIVG